jgi:preprotein translocase subunit SecF
MFVSAMLAISGYSVNDTIVIFSRFREDLKRQQRRPIREILNHAIEATFIRSLNTSLATILVLISLLLFGGATIRWFIVALLIGMAVGTYSSIFVAAPALALLTEWKRANRR